MNLEQVTAELRPRGAWEAADFGARLIRRDAVEIYKTWFALTLPLIGLALLAIYFGASGMWVFIVYWWLEPITDGPILHIISRRLFGENIDHRAALKAAPGLAWRNKLFWLTPYRFHFARSIAIPVVQLEGLSGTKRRERSAVLNHGIYNYGVGVSTATSTFSCRSILGSFCSAICLCRLSIMTRSALPGLTSFGRATAGFRRCWRCCWRMPRSLCYTRGS